MLRRLIASIVAALLMATVLTGSPGRADVLPTTKVVFVGDSIMLGAYMSNQTLDPLYKRMLDKICGNNTACRTNAVVDAQGGRCLIAAGCAGTPLSSVYQSEVLDQYHPTTVVALIGINDLSHVDDATFAEGYKDLVYPTINAGAKIFIAGLPPTCGNWQYKSVTEPQRQRMNGWLTSYFGSPTVFPLDILRLGSTQDVDPTYAKDGCSSPSEGVHPNFIGDVRIADVMPSDQVR